MSAMMTLTPRTVSMNPRIVLPCTLHPIGKR